MNKLSLIIFRIKRNKTIRNGTLFSIYSFFNKGIGFLLLILLANYIMPTEYGLLSLFTTIAMFMGYFIDMNTHGYLSISYFKGNRDNFRKDFSVICLVTIVMSILIGLILCLFHEPISKLLKFDVAFLFLCFVTAFCSVFVAMNLDYLRVQEKVSLYGVLSCSFAILNMIFSLYLVINKNLNWQGRVYAQIACDIIFFIISIIWFIKDRLFCFPKEWSRYRKILEWAIPLSPHVISNWIRQGCDRYIIDMSYTTADVGIFSFALNLTSIIIMIGMAFNSTNSVNLYHVLSSKDIDEITKKNSLKRLEKIIFLCYLVATIVIVLGVSMFIPILLPHYLTSIPYFLILAIYGFMQCLYFLYCNYLFYFDRTKQLMYITLGSSIFHLVLSICFTRFSLYITCIIYVLTFTLITFLVKRKARKIYPL